MRGSVYLLGGMWNSVFGVPFAVAGSVYLGMKLGLLLTMSVLQFGFRADWLAGLVFPQYLFYIPSVFYLWIKVTEQSMKIWKNKGMITGGVSRYFLQVILSGIFYLLGMLTEVIVIRSCWNGWWKKIGIFLKTRYSMVYHNLNNILYSTLKTLILHENLEKKQIDFM